MTESGNAGKEVILKLVIRFCSKTNSQNLVRILNTKQGTAKGIFYYIFICKMIRFRVVGVVFEEYFDGAKELSSQYWD